MRYRLLPLGLGVLAWVACVLLLLANLAVQATGRTEIKLVPALAGVTTPDPIPTAWGAVLDGRFQAAFGRRIGSEMPLYRGAIRLRNQVEYSLFGFSPNPIILVGEHGNLVERAYAEDWCSRNLAQWRPGAMAWAARIRQMQDEQARRRKAFLYVLTPSKVAQYPELLPPRFNCPSAQSDRVGLIPAWIALLQQAGVHVVDTTAVLQAAHGAYPFRLFPPGGTHWNAVGEALAQAAVLAEMDRLLPGHDLAPPPFTWHMLPHPLPNTDDVDLARLMNLFVPAVNGPVPAVTTHPSAPTGACQPSHIAIVGGSFSHATLKALGELPCPPAATEYEYWHVHVLRWEGGALNRNLPLNPADRDADILAADLVLYEENEEVLRHPDHGEALWSFLRSDFSGGLKPTLQH